MNEHIQISLATGVCIIALALYFKKVLHIQVPLLESSFPAFVALLWEFLHKKNKLTRRPWTWPWFWGLLMLLAAGLVILRRMLLAE